MNYGGLSEVEMTGYGYLGEVIEEKLDRVLASKAWHNSFPEARVG